MMTPRERVLCRSTMKNQIGCRCSWSFGATTLLTPLYEKMKAHFGIDSPTRFLSQASQQVMVDPRIRDLVGADGQPIVPGPSIAPLAKTVSEDCLVDDFGTTWRRAPGSIYFEMHDYPLRGATIDDLEGFAWPDLAHPSRFQNLRAEAEALHEQGQAVLLFTGAGIFRPPAKCEASSNCSTTWRRMRSLSRHC